MRKWIFAALIGVLSGMNSGCILPTYSGDPKVRAGQLMHTSEDLRNGEAAWYRFWHRDSPSHMVPSRTDGTIVP